MNRLIDVLGRRFGLFRTWGSFGRVAAWAAIWMLVLSAVAAPHLPRYTDRPHDADRPPSEVRYVGPISTRDFGGYLPPPDVPGSFRLAWIGGSEIKLREVSVPGEFSRRVATVGGQPLLVDSYNLIAPRLIDVIRAVETAADSGADAIVIALNPAWTRSEWSMRGWPNLDVSNLGSLVRHRSTWSWAAALTSPADVGWRLSRAAFPVVEAQARLNERLQRERERLSILTEPVEPRSPDPGDPRLPPEAAAFWLVQEDGPDVLADGDTRVGALMDGIGVDEREARFFAHRLVEAIGETGVPGFLYATPFAAESLAKPEFAASAERVAAFWEAIAADIDDPRITLVPRSATDTFPAPGLFFNNVHMNDAGPFADILVGWICTHWSTIDPTLECA